MDFLRFFNGTVKIKITGSQPERFINLCLVNKISLSGLSRVGEQTIMVHLAAQDIKKIRPILRKSACRMRIIDKSGLPFLKYKALRRKGFMMGGLLFCLFLYIFSTFIWSIEINTPKPLKLVSAQQIVKQANIYGLKPGVSKLLLNNNQLREKLMKDFPDASWIGVDVSGTRAIITIYERYKVLEKESAEPANLVADKDAVIEDVLVIKGTAVVSKGTTVKRGDLLISSHVYPTVISGQEPYAGEPMLARAKGIVRARTWYDSRAKILLKEEQYYHTGNINYGLVLKIPDGSSKVLRISDFTTYEETNIRSWRNKSFALELKLQKYLEIKKKTTLRTPSEAKEQAMAVADKKILKLLPADAKLVNKNYIWYNIKNGISVRAIWEVRENIGINR